MGQDRPRAIVIKEARRLAFLRLLSSSVTTQALTSAGSFMAGLILIRRTADSQYGYYVLVTNAMLLLTTLQLSFTQPPIVTRLARLGPADRSSFVGGIYRNLRRLWPYLVVCSVLIAAVLRIIGLIGNGLLMLVAVASISIACSLYREFFRNVLLAYRQPNSVLRSDFIYVAMLVAGVWFASYSQIPATTATLALGLAAAVGGALCAGSLWRFEKWDIKGVPGVFGEIAPLALWSTAGAIIHWLFSQGYSYVVAGTLDVSAVAAIAAMRLLIMPVNLLSTGIGSMMLPTISTWLTTHSARKVFVRQGLFSLGIAFGAVCYFLLIWVFRDQIFDHVLKKHSPSFDTLLLLWCFVALLMLFRDQLIYLLVVRGRFRPLAALTLGSAIFALGMSYIAMRAHGVIGALVGVLVGELLNVTGILVLCFRETRLPLAVASA